MHLRLPWQISVSVRLVWADRQAVKSESEGEKNERTGSSEQFQAIERPIMSCLLTFLLGPARLRTVGTLVGRPAIAGTVDGNPGVPATCQPYHVLLACNQTPELDYSQKNGKKKE